MLKNCSFPRKIPTKCLILRILNEVFPIAWPNTSKSIRTLTRLNLSAFLFISLHHQALNSFVLTIWDVLKEILIFSRQKNRFGTLKLLWIVFPSRAGTFLCNMTRIKFRFSCNKWLFTFWQKISLFKISSECFKPHGSAFHEIKRKSYWPFC